MSHTSCAVLEVDCEDNSVREVKVLVNYVSVILGGTIRGIAETDWGNAGRSMIKVTLQDFDHATVYVYLTTTVGIAYRHKIDTIGKLRGENFIKIVPGAYSPVVSIGGLHTTRLDSVSLDTPLIWTGYCDVETALNDLEEGASNGDCVVC